MAEATPVRAGEAWCSRGQKPWPVSPGCNGQVTCNRVTMVSLCWVIILICWTMQWVSEDKIQVFKRF